MKEEIIELLILYCDNTSAIHLSKNPMMHTSSIHISKNLLMHTKTNHIAIKYHYLRELVQDKEVKMDYVNRKEQIVDIFKKALPKDAHEYLRGKLGVIPLSEAM